MPRDRCRARVQALIAQILSDLNDRVLDLDRCPVRDLMWRTGLRLDRRNASSTEPTPNVVEEPTFDSVLAAELRHVHGLGILDLGNRETDTHEDFPSGHEPQGSRP